MQRTLLFILLLGTILSCSPKKEVIAPKIVPLPVSLTLGHDHLTLQRDITLVSKDEEAQLATTVLSNYSQHPTSHR
jgi:hypothetical protein